MKRKRTPTPTITKPVALRGDTSPYRVAINMLGHAIELLERGEVDAATDLIQLIAKSDYMPISRERVLALRFSEVAR